MVCETCGPTGGAESSGEGFSQPAYWQELLGHASLLREQSVNLQVVLRVVMRAIVSLPKVDSCWSIAERAFP